MFEINTIFLLLVFGCLSGFFAGLLGAGGGMIIVPLLFFAFKLAGYNSEILMHLAVGTSLAIIFPTSIITAYTHYKIGNLDQDLLKYCSIFIFFGIILGSIFTSNINTTHLLSLFAVYKFISCLFFILFKKNKLSNK